MQMIYQNLTPAQINRYGLILTACGISFHAQKAGSAWNILVDEANTKKAFRMIEKSIAENQTASPSPAADSLYYSDGYTGLWIALVIISVYIAMMLSGAESKLFMNQYQSSAVRIAAGDYYRTVTSLFFHADAGHLAGNAIGIAFFGTFLCRITGWGLGMLMLLLSGRLGNLLNALMYRTNHISIGASTAVFSSIGFLAGYLSFVKFRQIRIKRSSWLPIGGSIALLSFMGSGEHTDVTAHFYGMAVGIFFGILYAAWGTCLQKTTYQLLSMFIVICVIAGCFFQGYPESLPSILSY